jgi:hypothetical protein
MSINVEKMRKIQFAELFEFMVVADHQSFTRAAAQLGGSTAMLSQTIRAVENRLSAPAQSDNTACRTYASR